MKKILLVPLLTASLTLPLIGTEVTTVAKTIQAEQTISPKQKMIDELLADFQAGKYNNFLKKSDKAYKAAEEKWENNPLLEERKKLSSLIHDYGIDKTDALSKKITALREAKNRELIEISLNYPNEKISHEVRDMVFFSPTDKEKECIDFIYGLTHKFKGDGTTPIENKLINIDIEFWLKNFSLEIAKSQSKIDNETFQKQGLILQLEKIKQMNKACEADLVDAKIKSYVNTASTLLPKVYASAATRKYLIALATKKMTPQNPAEKELQAVMIKYMKKEEALTEEFFPPHTS